MFTSAMAPLEKGYSPPRYTRPMGAISPSLKVCSASMPSILSVTFAALSASAAGPKSITLSSTAKVTHIYTALRNSSKPCSSTSESHCSTRSRPMADSSRPVFPARGNSASGYISPASMALE